MIRVVSNLKSLIILLTVFLHSVYAQKYKLQAVQVIFRHGERTPRVEELYPKDPYGMKVYGSTPPGELTNQGKMTEYRLGQMLRERYNKFLGRDYRSTDLHAVSTNLDRTKMSLQLVLAGLYPPSPSETWNKNLLWTPIPFNVMPGMMDDIMRTHTCSMYKLELEKVRNSIPIRAKLASLKDFFQHLNDNTGLRINSTGQVFDLYSLLTSQKNMNLTLPKWCTDSVLKKLEDIAAFEFDTRSYTPKLKTLNGGVIIKRFVRNLNIDEKDNSRSVKLFLYSAHDLNVGAFARAHGFQNPKIPPCGSAVIMEKLKSPFGKIFIRMLYWSGGTEKLIVYNFSDHGEYCPANVYLRMVANILPTDAESHCLWNKLSIEDLKAYYDSY